MLLFKYLFCVFCSWLSGTFLDFVADARTLEQVSRFIAVSHVTGRGRQNNGNTVPGWSPPLKKATVWHVGVELWFVPYVALIFQGLIDQCTCSRADVACLRLCDALKPQSDCVARSEHLKQKALISVACFLPHFLLFWSTGYFQTFTNPQVIAIYCILAQNSAHWTKHPVRLAYKLTWRYTEGTC